MKELFLSNYRKLDRLEKKKKKKKSDKKKKKLQKSKNKHKKRKNKSPSSSSSSETSDSSSESDNKEKKREKEKRKKKKKTKCSESKSSDCKEDKPKNMLYEELSSSHSDRGKAQEKLRFPKQESSGENSMWVHSAFDRTSRSHWHSPEKKGSDRNRGI